MENKTCSKPPTRFKVSLTTAGNFKTSRAAELQNVCQHVPALSLPCLCPGGVDGNPPRFPAKGSWLPVLDVKDCQIEIPAMGRLHWVLFYPVVVAPRAGLTAEATHEDVLRRASRSGKDKAFHAPNQKSSEFFCWASHVTQLPGMGYKHVDNLLFT